MSRYHSGEEPMVGDVVKRVIDPGIYFVEGMEYRVSRLDDDGDVGIAGSGCWYARNFSLIRRAATPEPATGELPPLPELAEPYPLSGCCDAPVEYKPECDNYYCRSCQSGQGTAYYRLAKNPDARHLLSHLRLKIDQKSSALAALREKLATLMRAHTELAAESKRLRDGLELAIRLVTADADGEINDDPVELLHESIRNAEKSRDEVAEKLAAAEAEHKETKRILDKCISDDIADEERLAAILRPVFGDIVDGDSYGPTDLLELVEKLTKQLTAAERDRDQNAAIADGLGRQLAEVTRERDEARKEAQHRKEFSENMRLVESCTVRTPHGDAYVREFVRKAFASCDFIVAEGWETEANENARRIMELEVCLEQNAELTAQLTDANARAEKAASRAERLAAVLRRVDVRRDDGRDDLAIAVPGGWVYGGTSPISALSQFAADRDAALAGEGEGDAKTSADVCMERFDFVSESLLTLAKECGIDEYLPEHVLGPLRRYIQALNARLQAFGDELNTVRHWLQRQGGQLAWERRIAGLLKVEPFEDHEAADRAPKPEATDHHKSGVSG